MNVMHHQRKALDVIAMEAHLLQEKWHQGPLTETEHRHLARLRTCLGQCETNQEQMWKLIKEIG